MSPKLRENFERLNAIAKSRELNQNQPEISSPTRTDKKRRVDSETHEGNPTDHSDSQGAKEYTNMSGLAIPHKLALETAIAAELEIANLSNGIAELEALLCAIPETGDRSHIPALIVPDDFRYEFTVSLAPGETNDDKCGRKRKS